MPQDNKRVIRIESILGGHSPTTHFSAPNQFRGSLGIDPALPFNDNFDSTSGAAEAMGASGLLRPVSCKNFGSTAVFASYPLWILDTPKLSVYYAYDALGSVYSLDSQDYSVTGLGDLNDAGSAKGEGAAYYDNYVYFSRSTTVARYGPLDGTPAFTDDYWVNTLSKTRLTDNVDFPADRVNTNKYPQHFLHRHSDGRLYIADVVGNQGTIHFIQTTKTTVEGDTNNGSTYNKLTVGYGLYPMAMESYGSDLAIAFVEGRGGQGSGAQTKAKIAFWDTTSTNVNKITWVEFPDSVITAMKNINGILYVFSGDSSAGGYRITRFVGGYTFEEVYFSYTGEPPFPGAVDGDSNRLLFGSYTNLPENAGSVYSYGLKRNLGRGIFSVFRTTSNANITSLKVIRSGQPNGSLFDLSANNFLVGNTLSGTNGALDAPDFASYQYAPSMWWSQTYKIGQPFKITKIRINLSTAIGANTIITPKIYVDDNIPSTTPTTLTVINNTNYPSKQNIVIRPENLTGNYAFWLELKWTGSALAVVTLPITIEYELIDD